MSLLYILCLVEVMFVTFNKYDSIYSFLHNTIIIVFSYYYSMMLRVVLLLFLLYRVPYCYSPFFFCVILIVCVFAIFVALFNNRLFIDIKEFFGRFIPVGVPLYICPLIGIAEIISYIIRPFVLILRPFINIRLGCYGAIAICNLCFINWIWFLFLLILFFYEVFVAIIHWYIIVRILFFSINH